MRGRSIIIYGAGAVANIVFFYLKSKELGQCVKSFAVSNGQSILENEKYGVSILEIEEAIHSFPDALVVVAAQKSTQAQMEENLNKLHCDRYYLVDSTGIVDDFYAMLYARPIEPTKIVFMNYLGRGYGCNPKYIAEKLIDSRKGNELDLVWIVDKRPHVFPDKIRTVVFESLEYYQEIATARIWVDNSRKQADIRKREGQYYVQTWHGAAPFKKVEKDLEGIVPEALLHTSMNDSEMIDLFLSGSEFYTNLIRGSFWYDKEIMKAGLPRHDIFWRTDEVRNRVKKDLGLAVNDGIVLLAPTFRDDGSRDAYDFDVKGIKRALEQRFKRNMAVLVSKHPNNRNMMYGFDYEGCIDVSDYDDFEELLAAAEILITDYSGCAYDFSYKLEPVFLYQRDYDKVCRQRGFYIFMEDVPYPRAMTNDELIKNILRFDYDKYQASLKEFMGKFGNYDCGEASGKVAGHILRIFEE